MTTNSEYSDDLIDFDQIDLSLRPSPVDDRDWRSCAIYPEAQLVPKVLDFRESLRPIRNQGRQGACVAFSACAMKEYHEYKDDGFLEYMSCQFIYNLRDNHPNFGMFLRDAMKILQKKGVCTERMFPYNKNVSNTVPEDTLQQAKNFKVKNYAQVNTADDLKKALYKNGPCIIAFPVYTYKPEFWKQEYRSPMKGGHCVAVVGYNQGAFILRNSWGKDWGKKWGNSGYCYYKFSDWGSHWEVWTSVDDNSSVLEELKYDDDSDPTNNDKKDKKNRKEKTAKKCWIF